MKVDRENLHFCCGTKRLKFFCTLHFVFSENFARIKGCYITCSYSRRTQIDIYCLLKLSQTKMRDGLAKKVVTLPIENENSNARFLDHGLDLCFA